MGPTYGARMSRFRTVTLALAGGILLGLFLFTMTSGTPTSLGGPIGRPPGTGPATTDHWHYDPWTGQPQPETRTYTVIATGEQLVQAFGLPDSMQGTRAIPVPVGFAVGSLLTLVVIALRRPRSTSSGYAASTP
jgi:hypothetical protein